MRYYVTADVHGHFSLLEAALREQGYFDDTQPHKLIVCGDLYDRGGETLQLQAFILDLMERDEVILIRGNHEDLALHLLHNWHTGAYFQPHHLSNGTVDTFCRLAGVEPGDLCANTQTIGRAVLNDPYIQKIIPSMVDYYETEHYIFVHGWIPCTKEQISESGVVYAPVADWRNADSTVWSRARWVNGMEAAHGGIVEPGKTIVCGHWHCSFGHALYEGDGGEYDNNPNYTPYYGEGIIALDACTVRSQRVNCIVLED